MKKILLLLFFCVINIINAQVANQPSDLEVCDDDNDGIFCFNLSVQNAQILGSQNPADYSITFHASQADADSDSNPLPITYCNTSSVETIFVRLEDNTNDVMYDTTSFNLIVNIGPVLTSSSFSYVFCEFDFDNIGQFNFTDITASLNLLQAPQNINDFTVTYHATFSDAMNNSAPFGNGYENITDPQTVYMRVTNNGTGCFNQNNIASLELIVESAPTAIQPSTYQLCADDQSNQNRAGFDLTSLDSTIIDGESNVSVSYYLTANDATATTNAITSPQFYINTTNPQTIYARTQNNINGCYSNTVLCNLQVNPLPVVTLPDDEGVCTDLITGEVVEPFSIGTDLGPGHIYSWSTPQGTSNNTTVTVTTLGTYSLTVTDSNTSSSCNYFDTVTYVSDMSACLLSVEEANTANIVIYPNPVKDELILQSAPNLQVESFAVYSLAGKMVTQREVSINESVVVNVRNFNSGFYILKIDTKEKGTFTKQFIVE